MLIPPRPPWALPSARSSSCNFYAEHRRVDRGDDRGARPLGTRAWRSSRQFLRRPGCGRAGCEDRREAELHRDRCMRGRPDRGQATPSNPASSASSERSGQPPGSRAAAGPPVPAFGALSRSTAAAQGRSRGWRATPRPAAGSSQKLLPAAPGPKLTARRRPPCRRAASNRTSSIVVICCRCTSISALLHRRRQGGARSRYRRAQPRLTKPAARQLVGGNRRAPRLLARRKLPRVPGPAWASRSGKASFSRTAAIDLAQGHQHARPTPAPAGGDQQGIAAVFDSRRCSTRVTGVAGAQERRRRGQSGRPGAPCAWVVSSTGRPHGWAARPWPARAHHTSGVASASARAQKVRR